MAEAAMHQSPGKQRIFNFSPRHVLNVPQWKSLKGSTSFSKKILATPSPLDRICGGLKERANQFGLTPRKDQFLQNQSCPSIIKECGNEIPSMGDVRKCALNKFNGDSLTSFNFSPNQPKEAFLRASDSCRTLSNSWVFCNYVAGGCPAHYIQVRNPNKAVVTINARTTEILVANKMACALLGSKSNVLGGKKLCDFFVSKKDQSSLSEVELKDSGELIFISGKVMEIVTSDQKVVPVSVWARRIENEEQQRCLVVMEQVDRTSGLVNFDLKGKILNCDKNFATLHGYTVTHDLEGMNILSLIPSLILPLPTEAYSIPKEIRKQRATGRTKEGTTFPLSIHIESHFAIGSSKEGMPTKADAANDPDCTNILYHATVWVFANISGLITVLPDGTIHSCNTNFSLMLFGYTQDQLVGKNISLLIPSFYDDLEFLDTDSMPLPPLDDEEEDSNARCGCPSDGRNTADSFGVDPPRPVNPLGKCIGLRVDEDIVDGIDRLNFSPSPVDNNYIIHDFSSNFQNAVQCDKATGPQNGRSDCLLSEHASSCAKATSPIGESPESSSLCIESSRQLSVSESQDTLHSCANSVTESDINANVLDTSANEVCVKSPKPYQSEPWRKSVCDSSSNSTFSSDTENDNPTDEEDNGDGSGDKPNCTPLAILKTPSPSFNHMNFIEDYKNTGDGIHIPVANLAVASTPRVNGLPDRLTSVLVSNISGDDSFHSIPEGNYAGIGRHQDGTDLAIVYQIRKVELEDGSFLYCLWVTRDPEEYNECHRSYHTLTVTSSHNSAASQAVEATTQSALHDSYSSQFSNSSSIDMSDFMLTVGGYSENYTVLQRIGKGAFGCVMKSYRNSDGLLVVTKFIKKSKIYKELWVHDNTLNHSVPLEVSLLLTISHPNIVRVLDVFENEDYIQMVMEKHGAGMDLFEFIERNPNLDELLASYIFRQMVSAISYLHGLSIIHRDIKDENVILDEKFHVKLIDFGSATFMYDDELFSTFCGTMEYCSPEVIQGEKYRGPELEMWALGVTLYTLIFGENPFVDVEETILAELHPTSDASNELMSLIRHLLDPDPTTRCTLSEVQDHPWTNQVVEIEKYKFEEVVRASAEEINPARYFSDIVGNKKVSIMDSVSTTEQVGKSELSLSTDNLTSSESSGPNYFFEQSDIESIV